MELRRLPDQSRQDSELSEGYESNEDPVDAVNTCASQHRVDPDKRRRIPQVRPLSPTTALINQICPATRDSFSGEIPPATREQTILNRH